MTHDELIAALEAADGPSRELDGEIGRAVVGFDPDNLPKFVPNIGTIPSPWLPYTLSIDAAMTAVPERWVWRVGTGDDDQGYAAVWQRGKRLTTEIDCWAPVSPAIALTIAALRARKEIA